MLYMFCLLYIVLCPCSGHLNKRLTFYLLTVHKGSYSKKIQASIGFKNNEKFDLVAASHKLINISPSNKLIRPSTALYVDATSYLVADTYITLSFILIEKLTAYVIVRHVRVCSMSIYLRCDSFYALKHWTTVAIAVRKLLNC